MKKRYFLIVLLIPILFLLFGGSLKQNVYYVKKNEEVHFLTKPAFFGKFLKPKSFSQEGKHNGTLRCFLRPLDYEVNVLSFDERSLVIKKGEKYSPDTSGLTKGAKIASDVPVEKISDHPGIHVIKVDDHGKHFKKKVAVVGFDEECLYLKKGEEKSLDFGVPGKWKVTGDSITVDDHGEVEAVKGGESRVTFTCNNKKAAITIKVLDMKILGNAGEEFALFGIDGIKYSSRDENVVRVEDGKAILTGGGFTSIIYKIKDLKGKIPVYSSYYENGDATGKVIKVAEDGIVHRMTVWCQHARNYSKYNTFLAGNGCSLCSLTSILNGYAEGYEDKSPPEVMDSLEREVIGDMKWLDHHHNGNDGRAMPMTLNGINICMNTAGVHTEYVPSFDRESMKEDILNHLATGQPVLIEINKTNQLTNITDGYWSSSVHTVILAGIDGDQVIVADPANVSRGSGRGRIKKTSLDFISQYMWSCTEEPDRFYWAGKKYGGGYIKVYSE